MGLAFNRVLALGAPLLESARRCMKSSFILQGGRIVTNDGASICGGWISKVP